MKTIKKLCKVIILPTEDKTNLWLDKVRTGEGFSYLPTFGELQNNGLLCSYQDLYFISGDEVKKGDYGLLGGIIHRFTHNIGKPDKGKYLKIIATTDESLGLYDFGSVEANQKAHNNNGYMHLPRIPQSFVKEYAEQGGIDEVMVEYESKLLGNYTLKDRKSNLISVPKVNFQNEITIHPIKDSWNREEVKALIKKYEEDTEYYGRDRYYRNVDIPGDWIKENL